MTNNANAAPAHTTRTNVCKVYEGDTVTVLGARYLVIDEPTYVRRGQLYVRLVLQAVPAGPRTGILSGPYDVLAVDDLNVG